MAPAIQTLLLVDISWSFALWTDESYYFDSHALMLHDKKQICFNMQAV